MKYHDWLFLIYIFKWANFWTAPHWLFTFLWVMTILSTIVMPTISNYFKKKAEEYKKTGKAPTIFGIKTKVTCN